MTHNRVLERESLYTCSLYCLHADALTENPDALVCSFGGCAGALAWRLMHAGKLVGWALAKLGGRADELDTRRRAAANMGS